MSLGFAEDAATVFLHVEFEFAADFPGFPVSPAEVLVVEGDACFSADFLANLLEEIVFLVGGDEEGCGVGVEALLCCCFCCLGEAVGVAVGASVLCPKRVFQVFPDGILFYSQVFWAD